MQWMRFGSWVMCGVLFVGTGCSTTSTIYQRNAAPVEGDIQGGSETSIAVEAHGQQMVIPRSEITEVDYPGNVHAVVGGIFIGYGVLNVAVGMGDCSGNTYSGAERTAYCIGLFTPAALGLGMLIWGLVTNNGAKDAFNDTSRSLPESPAYAPGYAPAPYPPPGSYPPPASSPPPRYQPAPAAPPNAPPPSAAPAPPPSPDATTAPPPAPYPAPSTSGSAPAPSPPPPPPQ